MIVSAVYGDNINNEGIRVVMKNKTSPELMKAFHVIGSLPPSTFSLGDEKREIGRYELMVLKQVRIILGECNTLKDALEYIDDFIADIEAKK
jgi:hypothetical protein